MGKLYAGEKDSDKEHRAGLRKSGITEYRKVKSKTEGRPPSSVKRGIRHKVLDWVQNQKEFSASTKDIAAARVRAGSAEQYPGQRKYVDMYGYPNGKDPRFLVRREHGIYELYVAVKVAKKATTTKKRSATIDLHKFTSENEDKKGKRTWRR